MLSIVVLPTCAHGQGILANRYGNAKFATQFVTNCLHRIEQVGVLSRMTGSRHPVRGKSNLAEVFYRRSRNIGDRFRDGHAPGRRRIACCQRCPLTHRHRFACCAVESGRRDRDIADRHLPGSNKLITNTESAYSAITNVYQE